MMISYLNNFLKENFKKEKNNKKIMKKLNVKLNGQNYKQYRKTKDFLKVDWKFQNLLI